jgi:hypothetical protein
MNAATRPTSKSGCTSVAGGGDPQAQPRRGNRGATLAGERRSGWSSLGFIYRRRRLTWTTRGIARPANRAARPMGM